MILMLVCVAVAVAGLAVVIERIVYLNTNHQTIANVVLVVCVGIVM